jgi:photosystem II stability/assembly factor-like uncharacterized protein
LDPTNEPAPGLSRRARRAVTLIATSLAIIVVASLLYLHPKIGVPPPRPTRPVAPGPPLIHDQYWADFTFVTPTIGWAMVANPRKPQYWIFRTTDGAKTWQQQLAAENPDRPYVNAFFGNSRPFQFFNVTQGVAFIRARDVYITSHAGRDWTKVNLPPYNIESLTFSDLSHGWLLGWTQPDANSPIYHLEQTTDGGITWTALPSPAMAKKTRGFVITGLKFRTPTEGYASGTDIDQPSVYTTKDGGVTWQQHVMPVTRESAQSKYSATSDIALLPGRGVIAAFRNAAFTSFDGGEAWRLLPPPPSGSSYRNFAFQDATHWWSMQYDSNLYKTSDAGQSWDWVSDRLDEAVYEIGVVDAKHGWAKLNSLNPRRPGNGLALTSDGGIRWTYANVPNPP